MRERLRALDARGVPRAAHHLRRVLAAGNALDRRVGRRSDLARRTLTPTVLAALVVGMVLAAGASALDELEDRVGAGGAPPSEVLLGPPPDATLQAWAVAVGVELGSRAREAPDEPTLALVVPREPWTPEQAAVTLEGFPMLQPFTAVVRPPDGEQREVGVRVLPGDLTEQVDPGCPCTAALLVRGPLADLALLAERPEVLAVQPAPRGTREPSRLRLRAPGET